jgi:hypothetical protein
VIPNSDQIEKTEVIVSPLMTGVLKTVVKLKVSRI